MRSNINKFNPFVQAGAILIFLVPVLGIANGGSADPELPWQIAATALLLFAAANPIIGIFQKRWGRYVAGSIISFVVLTAAIYALTHYMAAVRLSTLPHMRMLFISVIVFYLMITFLVMVYRNLVAMLGKME